MLPPMPANGPQNCGECKHRYYVVLLSQWACEKHEQRGHVVYTNEEPPWWCPLRKETSDARK